MDGNEARALAVLEGARAARSRPEAAEAAVLEALALAPDDLDVLTGAYKFYFYNNRLAEALPHAQAILVLAARRLNVATDWRQVHAADADFATFDKPPRLYLQSLVAFAYCLLRTGTFGTGLEALAKAAELDPSDRIGAARLAEVVRRGTSGGGIDDGD